MANYSNLSVASYRHPSCGAIRVTRGARFYWQKQELPLPALMRLADFQRKYNVSRSTVYRLEQRGEIRFVHIGRAVRIPTEDAERWYAAVTGGEANDV